MGGASSGWGVTAADRPDHRFDVLRGALQGQVEQHPLSGGRVGHRGVSQRGLAGGDVGGDPSHSGRVGAGDPGDRPHLGVGQPPGGERRRDRREVLQGVRDSQVFGGGASAHPGPPGQPLRTRTDPALGPPASIVELGQQLEEPAFRGGDVPGQAQQLGLQLAGAHALGGMWDDGSGGHETSRIE